jgi:hypothetical protein
LKRWCVGLFVIEKIKFKKSKTAHEDAKGIRDAIKGLGTDDAKLVAIITKRSNAHLVAVGAEYTVREKI